MMTINRLAALAFCAGCALLPMWTEVASAHEGHSHGSANIVVPETAEGVLQEIQKHHAAVSSAVNGRNLKAVHDHAEAMTALAKALPAKVSDDRKTRVEGTTNNMTKLLDTLHHAADDGDQPRSGIELKKLDGAVTTLEKQLKAE
ncbi:MAG TPA: hypothetical protein VK993_01145 [Chthoniobacterales bacterium]|nr:hypothetical protein [Chthoniobacterales bacterium]